MMDATGNNQETELKQQDTEQMDLTTDLDEIILQPYQIPVIRTPENPIDPKFSEILSPQGFRHLRPQMVCTIDLTGNSMTDQSNEDVQKEPGLDAAYLVPHVIDLTTDEQREVSTIDLTHDNMIDQSIHDVLVEIESESAAAAEVCTIDLTQDGTIDQYIHDVLVEIELESAKAPYMFANEQREVCSIDLTHDGTTDQSIQDVQVESELESGEAPDMFANEQREVCSIDLTRDGTTDQSIQDVQVESELESAEAPEMFEVDLALSSVVQSVSRRVLSAKHVGPIFEDTIKTITAHLENGTDNSQEAGMEQDAPLNFTQLHKPNSQHKKRPWDSDFNESSTAFADKPAHSRPTILVRPTLCLPLSPTNTESELPSETSRILEVGTEELVNSNQQDGSDGIVTQDVVEDDVGLESEDS